MHIQGQPGKNGNNGKKGQMVRESLYNYEMYDIIFCCNRVMWAPEEIRAPWELLVIK